MSDDALRITDRVSIPRSELEVRATRSGGPGGQHVNTSSTRIELRWNLLSSVAIDENERARAAARLASRLDSDGFLRVVSSATRSQRRNRDFAEDRLVDLLRGALAVPRKRVRTKPSRAAMEARLDAKKRRGRTKKERGAVERE